MKQLNSLKVWLSVVLLLCFSLSGQAQFLRTSYFMEGSNQRMQLNPALMPGRGYLNIPVIGSLNATSTPVPWGIGILWTLLKTVMTATIS